MNVFQRLASIILGWFVKSENAEPDKAQKKYRRIPQYCEHKGCKTTLTGLSETWHCRYCNKFFCSEHRLPESHECKGKLKAPEGNQIENYSRGAIRTK